MTPKQHFKLYVASHDQHGGIVEYHVLPNGEMIYQSMVELDRVMYMALTGRSLWAVLRQPFPDDPAAG